MALFGLPIQLAFVVLSSSIRYVFFVRSLCFGVVADGALLQLLHFG